MHFVATWLPVFSVVAVYAVRMFELRTKRDTLPGSIAETLTLRLFKLAGTLMLAGCLIEYFARGRTLQPAWYLAGLACAVASFAIRRRAIAALGKFWSLHVEMREGHQFVRSGPFRWMRHPTYFSMILELLCAPLMLNVYLAALVPGLLFVVTLVRRIRIEEVALVQQFGADYEAYQRSTPALIPYKPPGAT